MSMGLTATRRLAALASLLAATGCWVPLEKGRMLEARVQRLEVETKEQAQVLDVQVRERIALVDKKLREVQVKLDELNTVSRAKGADLGVAVARLGEELTKVKGDLEAQAHNLAQLQHQVAEAGKETETRLASLKGTGALDEAMARRSPSCPSRTTAPRSSAWPSSSRPAAIGAWPARSSSTT
jgi:TolA-binding protein